MKNNSIYIILILLHVVKLFAQNPGDTVFAGARILEIHFSFKQDNFLDSLYESHESSEYIAGDITIDGEKFDSVGVRFKGMSSFFGYPGGKKSFRVKFDKFKEQRFDGLSRINLNNGWSDPTLLREKLYLDFLFEHGIPAPRANFAKVYINDTYGGMYTLTEQVDKTFLQQRFGNKDGNLFKAERLATLEWKGSSREDYYENYHLQTNESENNWSDLLQLINIINNTSAEVFGPALKQVLDTEGYLKIWAANNLFMNLDSYLGSANNFYLYNDEVQSRFRWIIWDVNLAFGARTGNDTLDIFWNPEHRPLINRLLNNEIFKKDYFSVFKALSADFTTEYFYPRIDSLFDLIKTDYFADSLKMYSNDEVLLNIDEPIGFIPGLKSFINKRKQNITAQMNPATKLENMQIKKSFMLLENYPNPFNPQTTIKYSVDAPGIVSLKVFDLNGRQVADLVNHFHKKGTYRINFDASAFSSGIYLSRLITEQQVLTSRMLLIK